MCGEQSQKTVNIYHEQNQNMLSVAQTSCIICDEGEFVCRQWWTECRDVYIETSENTYHWHDNIQ